MKLVAGSISSPAPASPAGVPTVHHDRVQPRRCAVGLNLDRPVDELLIQEPDLDPAS
jgi:hypothetical protein